MKNAEFGESPGIATRTFSACAEPEQSIPAKSAHAAMNFPDIPKSLSLDPSIARSCL
jgi:hypothetical protein